MATGQYRMTLIVNLYGGPGIGKSTLAAQVFSQLKQAGINAELSYEYAKDLTWEERHKTLTFQPYVLVKQMYRVHRLIGKVDVVVTDSPLMLGLIYGERYGHGYPREAFENFVDKMDSAWNNLNYLLRRQYAYEEVGRNQNLTEALEIDRQIEAMLMKHNFSYYVVEQPSNAAIVMTNTIIRCLQAS